MWDRLWLPDADKSSHALHSGPFLPTKSRAPTCDTSKLKCAACLYAKASTRTPNNQAACLSPKACIAAKYSTSRNIRILHTSQSINRLEAMAREEGFKIESYHSDNGIFATANFKAHCERSQRTLSFSDVGAKHQNGIAECNIKTIAHWACANMLHLATYWPQCADSEFWPQTTDYGVWVFNRLPSLDSGITPNDLWSGIQARGTDMTRAHVFGCPVYVLDAPLQDGKKIPKWNPWAHLGLFLGFSNLHLSQVPLVLNIATGHISPQFHVIFDDKFETVHSLPANEPLNMQWA